MQRERECVSLYLIRDYINPIESEGEIILIVIFHVLSM